MDPPQRQQPNKSVVFRDSIATGVASPAIGKQSVPKGKHKSDRDSTHTSQDPYNRITEQHLKETSLETRNKERKDLEVKHRKISSFSSECPDVETDIFLENQTWDKDNESCEYEQSTDSVFVKGSLKTNLDYWKEIGTSDYILAFPLKLFQRKSNLRITNQLLKMKIS